MPCACQSFSGFPSPFVLPSASCLPLCLDVARYAFDKGGSQSARRQDEIALASNDRFGIKDEARTERRFAPRGRTSHEHARFPTGGGRMEGHRGSRRVLVNSSLIPCQLHPHPSSTNSSSLINHPTFAPLRAHLCSRRSAPASAWWHRCAPGGCHQPPQGRTAGLCHTKSITCLLARSMRSYRKGFR